MPANATAKTKNVKGCLVAACVWLMILAALAVAGKFFLLPRFKKGLLDKTGSASRYTHEIVVAADSFSGYGVLRSPLMKDDLAAQGIKWTVLDDKADYVARMNALAQREIQMAAFTIDSFVATGSQLDAFPGTIVMIIDETRGADAIVAFKAGVQTLRDLDDPNARIVMTPHSPSEFLARTVIAHFNLPTLPSQWWVDADGAGDVYKKLKSANRSDPRAYVLWEPYVSKALELEGVHTLLDSSKLKGYIVDVLVAERSFLTDNPELVQAVVEAYFRAAYVSAQKTNGMVDLVRADATLTGSESLNEATAEKLVQGIQWKTTVENYAHFGLLGEAEAGGAQHVEDMILNITDVLVKTGALPGDPFEGKANSIFYDQTLKSMKDAGYHPAKKLDVIDGLGPTPGDLGQVRTEAALRSLTDSEWAGLAEVGELRVNPIAFGRGTAELNLQSERDLADLCRKLSSWPSYYLLVVGHARAEGDPQANLKLAEDRARTTMDHLLAQGVSASRLKVQAAPPSGKEGTSQSVSFKVLEVPY